MKLLCLLTITGLAGAQVKGKPAQASTEYDYFLLDTSVNGRYEIFAGEKSLKIISKSFGLTIYAHAPDWNVTALREEPRERAQATYSDWQTLVIPSFNMAGVSQELKKPEQKLAGAGVTRNIFRVKTSSYGFWQTRENRKSIVGVEISTRKTRAPRKAQDIILHFLNLPSSLEGVPVAQDTLYSDGTKGWHLKQIQVRTLELKESSLAPEMEKYKSRGKINQVFLGKSAMKTFDGLSDMLGNP
jgi:hypothetical protein